MEIQTKQHHQKNFIFDHCDTVELANQYGTPLYVVSENLIREKCRAIKEEFLMKYPNTKAAYASKAFLTLAMCKIIEGEGLGLDVVSGGELYTAIQADFPMEKIMFHGNNKSYEELEMAVANNVGRIIVDNFFELEMLEDICSSQKKKVNILFRITPEVEGNTHSYITTGQKDSKFGIPLQEKIIESAVIQVTKSSYIDLKGFHFHVGSQLFDQQSYTKAIATAVKLMETLYIKYGFVTEELNTGGGFGINYTNEETMPIHYFVDYIMEAIEIGCREANLKIPTIIIEPGRWIVGEAGITLYTLGAIKEIPEVRTYVSVDGGLPDNPRPALYQAKYKAIVANKINEAADKVVTIAGKCCETGDILIWDLLVPTIEAGDILAVLNTGAYNFSMASNYNRLPRPAVALISDGEPQVIVERETYQHLIERESIPSHLINNKKSFNIKK
ncbi:diaminopimelate decarboxylase [Alkaliphilus hydrothermalis]|uniref:Diaminopimelate decarboxylase n=1 Tax=Alkaliphilus hydrothermalis TaxID=1482730 RepID=A0ABS2NU96_9FIRM|nr:diaminopimelate decarboxylase [Alkaliphilus hydrothermalis]MBM7616437.1 diaminopimelate decarboxylase [Alkaliphilus hydrothermalis]